MTDKSLACIILAAGKGSRLKSSLPKVLHKVAGREMLGHLLGAVAPLQPDRVIVVVGEGAEAVSAFAAPHPTAIQSPQRGTADAVKAARQALAGFTGDVLVIYGDMPLIKTESLAALVAARRGPGNPALAMLGMRPRDPGPYGRFVMGPDGLERIVEALDASDEERRIGLCNAGPLAADGAALFDLLDRIGSDNAKGEFYLTDIVAAARQAGRACAVVEAGEEEAFGVNSRAELAAAEAMMQTRLRDAAMANGATLIDPATVYFSHDTQLGRDVVVGPNVFFGPGVTVADEAQIKSFCHIEKAQIGKGATIGPFARIRPGTIIGADAVLGNFVEIKNTTMGEKSQAKHLTYLGDTVLGARSNVGAGTITCNYDGFGKYRTTIGQGVFIGANTTLVAPITLGDGVIVGAGSTITQDVPADALALARSRQTNLEGRATRFRELKKKP